MPAAELPERQSGSAIPEDFKGWFGWFEGVSITDIRPKLEVTSRRRVADLVLVSEVDSIERDLIVTESTFPVFGLHII